MYQETGPLRFFFALGIAALPLVFLEGRGGDRWAWRYVALVLLGMSVAHAKGLAQFAKFAGATLRSG